VLWETALGSFLYTAQSKRQIRLSGFSFADDTDTIQTARNKDETWQQITLGLL
jgi:predicted aldo/keto reductase-like oxidoreductase